MLLECQGLRVDRGGVTVLEDFELEVAADSVALIGGVDALFDVMSSRAQPVAGHFEIDGVDARVGVTSGRIGLVLAGQPRAPRWTVLELLCKSALLAGLDSSSVRERARSALESVGLSSLGSRRLSMLSRVELTAVEVGAALQTNPEVLALRAPFRGLDAVSSDWLWQVIERGAHERQLLVSFDTALLDGSAKLHRFEQLVMLRGQRLAALGPPQQLLVPSAYLLSVTRGGKRLAAALEEAGFEVRAAPELLDDAPVSLIVKGEQEPLARAVAGIATKLRVPVIELVPLAVGPNLSGLGGVGRERAM